IRKGTLTPTEFSYKRQMIRRDSREAIADQFGFLDVQRPFEVNMVQMDQRQQSRIAAALAHVQFEVEAFKGLREHARGQAFDPFIEVADQNARPGNAFVNLLRLEERSEEHTSELQSRENLVCRLLLEK